MPDATPANPADADGTRPVPDPTVLTTDQIRREIAAVTELFNSMLVGFKALNDEKFRSSEEQRKEQKADTKTAVDAALQAQKEAVREQTAASDRAITKSEGGMIEQLKQLGQTVDTKVTGLTTAHNDLKTRVERLESEQRGSRTQVTDSRQASSGVIAMIGIVITIGLAILAVIGFIAANPPG